MTQTLQDVAKQHSLSISDTQAEQLTHYSQLLWAWNEKLNLTRHTDYEKFVTRDVIDSIEVCKLIGQDEDVMDVGSGGGVPGIIMAILRPDLQINLCESVGKKAQALDEMIQELNLPIAVYNARAEDILEDFRFAVLTARAVGPLWKICTWFENHWHSIGRLLAIKGPKWVEERGEARHRGVMHPVQLRVASTYPMIGTESDSVILKLWQKDRPEMGPDVVAGEE